MRKPSPDPKGFNTLQREYSFRHPPKDASTLPIFQELVGPQINSFDALFEDPKGTEEGLVHDSLKYIPEKVVFDKIGENGADLGKAKGSRLSCKQEVVSFGELPSFYSLGPNLSANNWGQSWPTYGSRKGPGIQRTPDLPVGGLSVSCANYCTFSLIIDIYSVGNEGSLTLPA